MPVADRSIWTALSLPETLRLLKERQRIMSMNPTAEHLDGYQEDQGIVQRLRIRAEKGEAR